jgi:hypothetical protein
MGGAGASAPPSSVHGEANASPSQERRFSVFGVKSFITRGSPKPRPSYKFLNRLLESVHDLRQAVAVPSLSFGGGVAPPPAFLSPARRGRVARQGRERASFSPALFAQDSCGRFASRPFRGSCGASRRREQHPLPPLPGHPLPRRAGEGKAEVFTGSKLHGQDHEQALSTRFALSVMQPMKPTGRWGR